MAEVLASNYYFKEKTHLIFSKFLSAPMNLLLTLIQSSLGNCAFVSDVRFGKGKKSNFGNHAAFKNSFFKKITKMSKVNTNFSGIKANNEAIGLPRCRCE